MDTGGGPPTTLRLSIRDWDQTPYILTIYSFSLTNPIGRWDGDSTKPNNAHNTAFPLPNPDLSVGAH
jgi:hypothetical protein